MLKLIKQDNKEFLLLFCQYTKELGYIQNVVFKTKDLHALFYALRDHSISDWYITAALYAVNVMGHRSAYFTKSKLCYLQESI